MTLEGENSNDNNEKSRSPPSPQPPPSTSPSSSSSSSTTTTLANSSPTKVVVSSSSSPLSSSTIDECDNSSSPSRSAATTTTGAAATNAIVIRKRSFDEIQQSSKSLSSSSSSSSSSSLSPSSQLKAETNTTSINGLCSVTKSNDDDDKNDGKDLEKKEKDDGGEEEMKQKEIDRVDTMETDVVDESTTTTTTNVPNVEVESQPVKLKVLYAKQNYEVNIDLNQTVAQFKVQLAKLTSVTPAMQKLCYRGILDDNSTLLECGLKNGGKVMMIGSKMQDILELEDQKVVASVPDKLKDKTTKEPLCQQKNHKKIIDKGIPEYATPGWIGDDCPLPTAPLSGMVNKYGNKVRLTFKFEQDQLWIGTQERTQKVPMANIKHVCSEPIDTHPQYHIMGLQLGPTEASRVWLYWVPAQYVKAIKRAIIGD